MVCSTPSLAVPDNTPAGVTDTLHYNDSFVITDLNVAISTTHTWIGDLTFTLTHQSSGTQVVLIDRPGVPASGTGCSSDDISATVDDEGVDGAVEDTCNPTSPALTGNLVGGDPTDPTLLTAFDGENLAGSWALSVSDNNSQETGTLTNWCIVAEGGQPAFSVMPSALTSMQPPSTQITRQLTISNGGSAPLEWAVLEENSAPLPVSPNSSANRSQTHNVSSSLTEYYATHGDVLTPGPASTHLALPPAAVTANGGPIYYSDRAVFDAAFPGLPLEDFEDALWGDGAIQACPAPFDATTDNGCFSPGGILPGILFRDDPLNEDEGGSVNGLVGVGAGAFGTPSKSIVANTFVDSFEVIFDPPVNATAMDLMNFTVAELPATLNLYDESDQLIATTSSVAATTGNFWGVYSETPIARINIYAHTSTEDGAEGVDNIAFGDAESCTTLEDISWASVNPVTGTVPAGSSMPLDVTFDSTGLSSGVYSGTLCFNSNDPQQPFLRVPLTMTVALSSITLTKTVGLDPTACAMTNTLDLSDAGTREVTYCYTVQNTGSFTLTTHDLTDDQLGPILTAFPYDLAPGASVFVTTTTNLTSDTVNEAIWTAGDGVFAPVSANATATVTLGAEIYYFPTMFNSQASEPPVSPLTSAPVATSLRERN